RLASKVHGSEHRMTFAGVPFAAVRPLAVGGPQHRALISLPKAELHCADRVKSGWCLGTLGRCGTLVDPIPDVEMRQRHCEPFRGSTVDGVEFISCMGGQARVVLH